jgi:pSer/pThr/pTyr-binding forkhead associated (FHA) protein
MNKHSADAFLDACEATGPLQLDLEEAGATRQVLLHQPFALIGRHPRADLHLDDPEVSRRHAYLQIVGGYVYCLDLHSRTGTHWQQEPEHSSDWFSPGQVITIGPCRLRLIKGGREGQPPDANLHTPLESGDRGAAALPEVTLDFTNARPSLPPWLMNRPLVLLGAAGECKVRMHDLQVSGFHASLVNTPKGLWVVDLCGRGGIAVNGVLLRMARLDDGDQLRVGEIIIRVRCQQPRAAGAAATPRGQATAEVSVGAPSQMPALPSPAWMQMMVPLSSPMPFPALAALTPPVHLPAVTATETALVPAPAQPPAQREVGEQLLSTVINQFGRMQQQMFDHFQQTVAMMVQMFSGLHRDQMALLRQELDRVQELTQELTMLQAELAKQPAAPATGRPVTAAPAATLRLAQPSSPTSSTPAPTTASEQTTPAATGSATDAAKPAPTPPSPAPEDVHGWLHERIAAIQQERQSRWQKIRDFLLKSPSP